MLARIFAPLLFSAIGAGSAFGANEAPLVRTDRHIDLASRERLFVREVSRRGASDHGAAVLLIHGARVPGVASFDLPVAGGSLAADLADAGYRIYIPDLRGYGRSSRPDAMNRDPAGSAPLMRTADAVSDLKAVVEAVAAWSGDDKIDIVGWATGGHWTGAYASIYPASVGRLVLYNTLYGGSDTHPTLGRGSPLEDKQNEGTFDAKSFGGYRFNNRASLFPAWDASIPVEDKSRWRDARIAEAYADAALASDETAGTHKPASFRSPSGAMADSFELAIGKKQWSAEALSMPVLVIRSERDFWSRQADAEAIVAQAPDAQLLTIPDATHFVHLDRDEAGRAVFLSALLRFLPPNED
ncbi:MAG: alpha/beta fold hydrolase [Shinella sp.]|nr:alpha/beta fold hydrolase [Shinella sp.]